MRTQLRRTLVPSIGIALLLSVIAVGQKITSLNASAKGKGTISIAELDKHEITSVLIILKENGEADLTFYTDLQLAAQGTWSMGQSLEEGIDLKITGGVVSGNASGTGKLFLRKDGKSIDKLNITATSTDGSKVKVDFVADKPAKQTINQHIRLPGAGHGALSAPWTESALLNSLARHVVPLCHFFSHSAPEKVEPDPSEA